MSSVLHLVWCFSYLSIRSQAAAANLFCMMYSDIVKSSANYESSVFIDKRLIKGIHLANGIRQHCDLETAFDLFLDIWGETNQVDYGHLKENLVTSDFSAVSNKHPDEKTVYILNTSFVDNDLIEKVADKNCLIFDMGNKIWKELLSNDFKNVLITLPSIEEGQVPIKVRDNRTSLCLAPAFYPYITHTTPVKESGTLQSTEGDKRTKWNEKKPFKMLTAAKDLMDRISILEWHTVIFPIALTRNIQWTLIGADESRLYQLIDSLSISDEAKHSLKGKFDCMPFMGQRRDLCAVISENSMLYKGMQRGSGTLSAICVSCGVPVFHCLGSDASIYIGSQYPTLDCNSIRGSVKLLIDSSDRLEHLYFEQKKYLDSKNEQWTSYLHQYINILLGNSL